MDEYKYFLKTFQSRKSIDSNVRMCVDFDLVKRFHQITHFETANSAYLIYALDWDEVWQAGYPNLAGIAKTTKNISRNTYISLYFSFSPFIT